MTYTGDGEADLRHWLVDYLVTNVGCNPDEIDPDVPFNELGVGSRDGVVLAGELTERMGRMVSPVDIWQNPTINSLAHALTHPDDEAARIAEGGTAALHEPIAIIGLGCRLPGDLNGPDALWEFMAERRSAITTVPDDRWQVFDDGSPATEKALAGTTRWGSFLSDVAGFDASTSGSPRARPTTSTPSSG